MHYKEHLITLALVIVGVVIGLALYNRFLNTGKELQVSVQ
jgi:hypothetical protein